MKLLKTYGDLMKLYKSNKSKSSNVSQTEFKCLQREI